MQKLGLFARWGDCARLAVALAQGATQQQVAERLGISQQTVADAQRAIRWWSDYRLAGKVSANVTYNRERVLALARSKIEGAQKAALARFLPSAQRGADGDAAHPTRAAATELFKVKRHKLGRAVQRPAPQDRRGYGAEGPGEDRSVLLRESGGRAASRNDATPSEEPGAGWAGGPNPRRRVIVTVANPGLRDAA